MSCPPLACLPTCLLPCSSQPLDKEAGELPEEPTSTGYDDSTGRKRCGRAGGRAWLAQRACRAARQAREASVPAARQPRPAAGQEQSSLARVVCSKAWLLCSPVALLSRAQKRPSSPLPARLFACPRYSRAFLLKTAARCWTVPPGVEDATLAMLGPVSTEEARMRAAAMAGGWNKGLFVRDGCVVCEGWPCLCSGGREGGQGATSTVWCGLALARLLGAGRRGSAPGQAVFAGSAGSA